MTFDRGYYLSSNATTGRVTGYNAKQPRLGASSEQHAGAGTRGWGTSAEETWNQVVSRPWVQGAFAWTAFDYRGEPTPFAWPDISSHFGSIDYAGFPKDVAFYCECAHSVSKPSFCSSLLHLDGPP